MIKFLRSGLLAIILALAACRGTTAPTPTAPAEDYVCKGKINNMSYVVEVGTTQVGNYEVECSKDKVVLTHTSLTDCNGQYESKEKTLVYSMHSGDVWTVGEINLSCPTVSETPAEVNDTIGQPALNNVPAWSITGGTFDVVHLKDLDMSESLLVDWAAMTNRPLEGNAHWTSIDGGQYFTGDPGVYLTHNVDDAETNESALLITPMTWNDFDQLVERSPIWEGAYSWVNACGANVEIVQEVEGKEVTLAVINVECSEYHAWFVVIKGLRRDGTTPGDLNLEMIITNANSPFGHAQHFPPGDDLSAIYLTDNILSGFERMSSGADGYLSATILFFDPVTGLVTVSHVTSAEAEFEEVFSNLAK